MFKKVLSLASEPDQEPLFKGIIPAVKRLRSLENALTLVGVL